MWNAYVPVADSFEAFLMGYLRGDDLLSRGPASHRSSIRKWLGLKT